MSTITASEVKDIVYEMSEKANLDNDFSNEFFNNIINDPPVLNEFLTYLAEGRFTCENTAYGYNVVDILVFQMDHFKAFMDRGLYSMQNNECEMLLKAFDTFMKLKKDPDKILRLLKEESGSDYDGKFN